MAFPLFTSIPPHSNYQPLVDNWRASGFRIISINSPEEAAELSSSGVETLEAESNEKKLPLSAILRTIKKTGVPFAGLINADCKFLVPVDVDAIERAAKDSIILAERIDVDAHGAPALFRAFGFDAMFFDTSAIDRLKVHDAFKIGEPWWDYWLPNAFQAAGYQIKKLDCPALSHEVHSSKWTNESWERMATLFKREFPNHPACAFDGGQMAIAAHKMLFDSPKISVTTIPDSIARMIEAIPDLVSRATKRASWRDYRVLIPARWAWQKFKKLRRAIRQQKKLAIQRDAA